MKHAEAAALKPNTVVWITPSNNNPKRTRTLAVEHALGDDACGPCITGAKRVRTKFGASHLNFNVADVHFTERAATMRAVKVAQWEVLREVRLHAAEEKSFLKHQKRRNKRVRALKRRLAAL